MVISEELLQARDNIDPSDLAEGYPRCLDGVASCDERPRPDHLDVEVEDHVVVGRKDPLDPAAQITAAHLEPCLLEQLALDGTGEGLPHFQPPARNRPSPRLGRIGATDEKQCPFGHGYPTHCDDRNRDRPRTEVDSSGSRRHFDAQTSGRCIVINRALKPVPSKKFFVALSPGRAEASTARQPDSVNQSTTP